MRYKKYIIAIGLIIGAILFVLLYKNVDPIDACYMPKCLSYTIFGIRCPGCGTQRAIHAILAGDFKAALQFNPLIFASMLYIITTVILDMKSVKAKHPKLHNLFLGQKAISILLCVLLIYTILRNIFAF